MFDFEPVIYTPCLPPMRLLTNPTEGRFSLLPFPAELRLYTHSYIRKKLATHTFRKVDSRHFTTAWMMRRDPAVYRQTLDLHGCSFCTPTIFTFSVGLSSSSRPTGLQQREHLTATECISAALLLMHGAGLQPSHGHPSCVRAAFNELQINSTTCADGYSNSRGADLATGRTRELPSVAVCV